MMCTDLDDVTYLYNSDASCVTYPMEFLWLLYKNGDAEYIGDTLVDEEIRLCKIRVAPRKFREINVRHFETARLCHWDSVNGYYLSNPKYKVKDGIIRIDPEENLAKVKRELEAGQKSAPDELEAIRNTMNHITVRSYFTETGFMQTGREFGSDWASSYMDLYYQNQAFYIENRHIFCINLRSHWEDEFEIMKDTFLGEKWSAQQLIDWLCELDLMDSILRIYYINSDGTQDVFFIRMDEFMKTVLNDPEKKTYRMEHNVDKIRKAVTEVFFEEG